MNRPIKHLDLLDVLSLLVAQVCQNVQCMFNVVYCKLLCCLDPIELNITTYEHMTLCFF